ncbi:MAG: hypothetical protein MJK18_06565, partial [Bdellovibrionales bacterium]|nr:hypothetical protein [Bdellovibrionales bacterium]
FREAKVELERDIRKERYDVQDAELAYELEVNKLKQDCEQQAHEQFTSLTENIYSVPVGNPAQAAASSTLINSQWRNAYVGCWTGYENIQGGMTNAVQQTVQTLAKKMRNDIEKAREEAQYAREKLQELHQQTTLVQANTERNCREARELQDYNEGVIQSQHARALSANSQIQSLNTMGAVMSCISTGLGGMNPNNPNAANQNGNVL